MTPDLIAWLLDEARVALESDARTKDWPLRMVTTAPPGQQRQQQKHPTQPGEWRVLRCRIVPASPDESVIELLIAREQIGLS